jgi:hypothetical protein
MADKQSIKIEARTVLTDTFRGFLSSRYSYWLRNGRPRHRGSNSECSKNVISPMSSRRVLGMGIAVKRQGREAGESTPSGAGIRLTWVYTFTPPYIFTA